MEEKLVNVEIITKFLLSTTRLRYRLTKHAVEAAAYFSNVATRHPSDDDEAALIPLTTGSVAEFYIEPMLKCFGDIDVMYHFNYNLAIPQGHSPPTQLPAEFHNYVKVFEIIDSNFPGYAVVKIDCSKRLAFLLQDLNKLICNQQQLISKTDINAQNDINDPISATRKHNTRPINANWLS